MLYLYFLLWVQILSPFPQTRRSTPPAPGTPGSFPPQPAGMPGCTGHSHAPWNSSSASGPTRASQPRTEKIWTKQPLSSKCHIKDTVVLCSFNWIIVTCTLLSPGNSCRQSGNKLFCLCKQTKSLYRPIPAREPHLDASVISKQAEHPKGYGPHMLSPFPTPCSPSSLPASLLGSSRTPPPYTSCLLRL